MELKNVRSAVTRKIAKAQRQLADLGRTKEEDIESLKNESADFLAVYIAGYRDALREVRGMLERIRQ